MPVWISISEDWEGKNSITYFFHPLTKIAVGCGNNFCLAIQTENMKCYVQVCKDGNERRKEWKAWSGVVCPIKHLQFSNNSLPFLWFWQLTCHNTFCLAQAALSLVAAWLSPAPLPENGIVKTSCKRNSSVGCWLLKATQFVWISLSILMVSSFRILTFWPLSSCHPRSLLWCTAPSSWCHPQTHEQIRLHSACPSASTEKELISTKKE